MLFGAQASVQSADTEHVESSVLIRDRVALGTISLSARVAVGGMVVVSAAIRFLLGLQRPTINYLPDEYTYSALARGIADTGRPVIRGATVHFPALLEPILAAPFWLTGNPDIAMRLTQAEHAVFMSLGAIPVYLLARRLSLDGWASTSAAALALVTPNLLYASYSVAEPVAYPLVLAALYAAVVVLESPSRKAQLALLALIGLASFARIQYVLLLPVVLVAALLVERFRVRRVVAKCGLVAAASLAVVIVVLAAGTGRVTGVYGDLVSRHASAASVLHQLDLHALLLPFSAGIILVPGALIGLARALARSHSKSEHAFGWLTVLFGIGVVGEAVFVGAAVSGNYGERYLIDFLPLVPIAFGLYAKRGGGARTALALAAGLALLAMRVPVTSYAHNSSDSTFLYAVARAVATLGVGNGALLFSVSALGLAALAGALAGDPQRRARIALAVAVASQAGVAAAATSWDTHNNVWIRNTELPANASWVDDAHLGSVTLVQLPGATPGAALEQLFWNGSLDRLAVAPGGNPVDSNPSVKVHVRRDGGLVDSSGRRLAGSLLVDESSTWVAPANAHVVASFTRAKGAFELWEPADRFIRLAAEAVGIRSDGWLAARGTITVWPSKTRRTLILRLGPPVGARANTIRFDGTPGKRAFTLEPGGSRSIVFSIAPRRAPWRLHWSSDRYVFLPDGTFVSFRAERPHLVPDGAVGGSLT